MEEAELYLRESLNLFRSLHKNDVLGGTAWPTKRLADALSHQGKRPEAIQAYRDSLAAYRNCNAVGHYGFPEAVRSLVELLMSEGSLSEAQSILNEALAQERQAFGSKDVRTAATLIALARYFKLQSKQDQAADRCREAVDLLMNSLPEDLLHLPPAVVAEMIGVGLEREARELCSRVLALSRAAPNEASWLNAASWFLILAEKPAGQDPALALQLARKAAELPPEPYYYESTTLGDAQGAALYRAEDWHHAVIELEQASTHDEGNNLCCDLLFLAMAHHRLGNAELARRHYKQAEIWMTDHNPCHRLLIRVRAEAGTLLGL